jgi:4-oxalocrotonate tautomerase family enzyme
MPVITCDIRRGRSAEQRERLCSELSKVVSQVTGAPLETILVLVREHRGDYFMEGGELLPDYVAGPNGEDLAGEAALRRRQKTD